MNYCDRLYPYSFRMSHKPYTPDFTIKQGDRTIYIEHFGITEAGAHSRYSKAKLEHYKKEVNDKVQFHRDHGTELIYTFSQYKDGRPFLGCTNYKADKSGCNRKINLTYYENMLKRGEIEL